MDFNSQTCERRYLNDTFRPFGIPYDAKYVDTLEIGSNIEPDLGIEIYVWEGIDTESKEDPIRYSVLYYYDYRSLQIVAPIPVRSQPKAAFQWLMNT